MKKICSILRGKSKAILFILYIVINFLLLSESKVEIGIKLFIILSALILIFETLSLIKKISGIKRGKKLQNEYRVSENLTDDIISLIVLAIVAFIIYTKADMSRFPQYFTDYISASIAAAFILTIIETICDISSLKKKNKCKF